MSAHDRVRLWLLAGCLGLVAVASFIACVRAWRRNRVVEDTPTSRLRSAAQGYVEISGRGRPAPHSESKAPLSGIPCTWWRYTIQGRRPDGDSRAWTTLKSDTSNTPFLLDDGTGQCLVDPCDAQVFTRIKDVWYGETEWPDVCIPSSPGFAGWLADALGSGSYRYTEQRLKAGDSLYVIGAYRSSGGADSETECAAAELLHDWKADQKRLLERFDTDRNGQLSAAEWERARKEAYAQARESSDRTEPTLSTLSSPRDGRPFLIAASGGAALAGRLRRQSAVCATLFLSSATLLTWLLNRLC